MRRTAARIALAIVVLLGGTILIPAGGRGLVHQAIAQVAQPTPSLPPILPGGGGEDPEPSPSPTESEPSGGGGQKPGGGEKPGGEDEEPPEEDGEGGKGKGDAGKKDGKPDDGSGDRDDKKKKKKKKKDDEILPTPSIPGSFNTEELLETAARLRSLGMSEDEVASKVFAPFIIGGYATWIDTWGAPRYGPGPLVRTHEGQDVFCDTGTPLLAAEDGTIGLNGFTSVIIGELIRFVCG